MGMSSAARLDNGSGRHCILKHTMSTPYTMMPSHHDDVTTPYHDTMTR